MEKIKKNGRSFYLPSKGELEEAIKPVFGKRLTIVLKKDLYFKVFWQEYILPKWLTSDWASIPSVFHFIMDWFDYRILFAWLVHDYFYRTQFITKKLADTMFYELLRLNNWILFSQTLYQAVNWCWYLAWRKNNKNLLKFPTAIHNRKKFICEWGFNILIDNK